MSATIKLKTRPAPLSISITFQNTSSAGLSSLKVTVTGEDPRDGTSTATTNGSGVATFSLRPGNYSVAISDASLLADYSATLQVLTDGTYTLA